MVWKMINVIWCRFSLEVIRSVKLWSTLVLLLVCHTATQNPMYVLKEGNLRGLEEKGTARASEFEWLNACVNTILLNQICSNGVAIVVPFLCLFHPLYGSVISRVFFCLSLFSYGCLFFLELKSFGFEIFIGYFLSIVVLKHYSWIVLIWDYSKLSTSHAIKHIFGIIWSVGSWCCLK